MSWFKNRNINYSI